MKAKPDTTATGWWTSWYRLARSEFGYSHPEAVTYANLRYVEELNRRTVRLRQARR